MKQFKSKAGIKRCARVAVALVAVWLVSGGAAGASSWSVVPSPGNGALNSVSCTSWSACTAVGVRGNPFYGPGQVLAEHWNGKVWSVEPLTPPSGGQSEFFRVSCGAPRFCVAVGILVHSSTFTGGSSPLIGTWNGSTWSIRKLPPGFLVTDLSCTSRRFCVLATGQPVTWNGVSTSPMPAVQRLSFRSVSCLSASSCVGVDFGSAGAVSVRWNGRRWSVVTPLARPATGVGALSCSSANACTVISGESTGGDSAGIEFVERWNGARWLVQPGAESKTGANLRDVACPGRKGCVVVGQNTNWNTTAPAVFAERWDGARWSVQPTVTPDGAVSDSLQGVSCVASMCVTVGYWTPPRDTFRTLVEQYR